MKETWERDNFPVSQEYSCKTGKFMSVTLLNIFNHRGRRVFTEGRYMAGISQ